MRGQELGGSGDVNGLGWGLLPSWTPLTESGGAAPPSVPQTTPCGPSG